MAEHYDLLIENTTVVDGTGAPAFAASVGVRGDRIAAVGKLTADADHVVDGRRLITCPGFVDPHCHADLTLGALPLCENLVMQGVTTFVGGNCGWSLAPLTHASMFPRIAGREPGDGEPASSFGGWLDQVRSRGLSMNLVPLVGHNTLRADALGIKFQRAANRSEVRLMRDRAMEAMRDGAFGLSVGLDPAWPGHYATRDEISELVEVVREHDGVFAPHTRNYQNQWPGRRGARYGYGVSRCPPGEAITGRYHGLVEAIEIARGAGRVRTNIAHLVPAYVIPQPHPALLDVAAAEATLRQIVDPALDEGIDLWFNVIACSHSIGSQVPMIASFLSPHLALPEWLKSCSREAFASRAKTAAFRRGIHRLWHSGVWKFDMLHPVVDPYWMDCYRVIRCSNSELQGRTIGDIARSREPTNTLDAVYRVSVDVVLDILSEDPEATCALVVDKRESGSLATFLQHPRASPCSDVRGLPAVPGGPLWIPPIAYGLFPHYLRVFVKETETLGLEQAVRKATSVPARDAFRLRDRGILREGAFADVVVIDLDRLWDWDDFAEPHRAPEGIDLVAVNGKIVFRGGKHTGALPGQVLTPS